MTNDKEIQKDDFILPGDLGEINGGKILSAKSDYQKGTLTLTVAPSPNSKFLFYEYNPPTEDADFEILPPKQIEQ